MSAIVNNNLSKLWIRIKSYINARLESLDVTVEGIVNNAVENAGYTEMELLWENSSPTSSFAAQTISLDLSRYQFVKILFKFSASDLYGIETDIEIPIDEDGYCIGIYSAELCRRMVSVNSNGVIFNDSGRFATYASTTLTTSNDSLIPYRIYGIKGVK